jgi:hypothetical protein
MLLKKKTMAAPRAVTPQVKSVAKRAWRGWDKEPNHEATVSSFLSGSSLLGDGEEKKAIGSL